MLLAVLVTVSVLTALLLAPVDLVFKIGRRDSIRADVSVRWMFGLVEFDPRAVRGRGRRIRRRALRRGGMALRFSRALLSAARRRAAFRRRLLRFFRAAAAAVRPRDFHLRLRLGFDDPADTGMVWACLGPAIAVLGARAGPGLDVGADFERERLEFEVAGKLRIVPARLIAAAGAFALSPVTLRAMWTAWRRA